MKPHLPWLAVAAIIGSTVTTALFVSGALVTATDRRATCLHDAVTAYPAWSPGQPNVTDTLPSCTRLSVTERAQLRDLMGQFVQATVRNQARP